jgi:hypothetical protein
MVPVSGPPLLEPPLLEELETPPLLEEELEEPEAPPLLEEELETPPLLLELETPPLPLELETPPLLEEPEAVPPLLLPLPELAWPSVPPSLGSRAVTPPQPPAAAERRNPAAQPVIRAKPVVFMEALPVKSGCRVLWQTNSFSAAGTAEPCRASRSRA